jgi:hypothetical protein
MAFGTRSLERDRAKDIANDTFLGGMKVTGAAIEFLPFLRKMHFSVTTVIERNTPRYIGRVVGELRMSVRERFELLPMAGLALRGRDELQLSVGTLMFSMTLTALGRGCGNLARWGCADGIKEILQIITGQIVRASKEPVWHGLDMAVHAKLGLSCGFRFRTGQDQFPRRVGQSNRFVSTSSVWVTGRAAVVLVDGLRRL